MKGDGTLDFSELRKLISEKRTLHKDLDLRYFEEKLAAKNEFEKQTYADYEKAERLRELKSDWFILLRDCLCKVLSLNASRASTPPWSVTCRKNYTPKKIEDVMNDLWDNLGKYIDVPKPNPKPKRQQRPDDASPLDLPPDDATTKAESASDKRSVEELGRLYKQPLGFHGAQNDPRLIGKRTTLAYTEGGKAYSRRLFSKPRSTCMRGRKKSKRRNKRTRQRR